MKTKDILEGDVVDFRSYATKRDANKQLNQMRQVVQQKSHAVEQEDEDETQTVKELAEFEEWMVTAKKKGRIPGFETMDDAIAYLIADLELPAKIIRGSTVTWFNSLGEEDREKVRMIAHHADRLIEIYEMLKTKLHSMQSMWTKRLGKIPAGWDATDGAAWLDSEFTYDIGQLINLKKAIAILGQ